jgi:phosphatidylglycerol lysyltransferase
VSAAWLKAQIPAFQSGFSVAPFSTAFADHFPIAIVRKEQRMIGFASLAVSSSKTQAAINILRCDPAFVDVSDLLITGSMDWAKRQGFSEFSLGIAPLAAAPVKASLHLLNEPRSKNEFRKKYEPTMQTRFLSFSEKLDISDIVPSLATLTKLE